MILFLRSNKSDRFLIEHDKIVGIYSADFAFVRARGSYFTFMKYEGVGMGVGGMKKKSYLRVLGRPTFQEDD